MADAYDDHRTLTTTGTHRGGDPEEDTGRTVRAPKGPDPASGHGRRVDKDPLQLLRHREDERLRIRIAPDAPPPDDFEVVARYGDADDLHAALRDDDLIDEEHFLVLEDPVAREVHFTPARRLKDGGLRDFNISDVHVFHDETAAADFATRRQRELRSD
jgi:hypothetical protein